MIVTDYTRHLLAYRKEERDMLRAGWESVGEGGGRLWELKRGWRWGHRITDVRIAVDCKSLWVKIEEERKS
ncbi:hypothetical protein [Pandoraea sp. SD6-2]|uniref:hypothetical protein n=1 Tax=Pandoraea sp. SD6-2 TaxID=1286093 RepID=UPI00032EA6AE|nr:hypothetical protein [Pandoraea sp. SD6-2]EON13443.1 hypothetical protein C266_11320 [Pandoraea sp. SD6-2]